MTKIDETYLREEYSKKSKSELIETILSLSRGLKSSCSGEETLRDTVKKLSEENAKLKERVLDE